jgi:SUKH-3 immunity protein
MTARFSPSVLEILQSAGWFEGRNVKPCGESSWPFALFAKAQGVLSEFNGLHFGKCGPGIDFATSDVEIDPNLALHLAPELRAYETSRGTRLFPLGEVHRGHGFLVIDEQGNMYLLSDELEPFAPSFSQALEKLLLGRKILPPEEEEKGMS